MLLDYFSLAWPTGGGPPVERFVADISTEAMELVFGHRVADREGRMMGDAERTMLEDARY